MEKLYVKEPSPDNLVNWTDAQQLYRTLSLEKAENRRFFLKQAQYEEGERTGHMLALLARSQSSSTSITSIETPSGGVTRSP